MMIRVKDLSISFDRKRIIDGVSLFVPVGRSLALMGKNGSGKSVILKALSGGPKNARSRVRERSSISVLVLLGSRTTTVGSAPGILLHWRRSCIASLV